MLSVLFATRNRARTLRCVLDAYSCLQGPSSGWKLIIVDNGSIDRTREVVESFQTKLPLTFRFEERLGKNFALNAGLAELKGDLAIFTDDDAFPHRDWLLRIRAAADAQPSYSMFGGVILPRWEVAPPHWLKWVPPGPGYTLSDPHLAEGPTDPGNLFGPNMAIRAEIFRSGVQFDTSIGPRGTNYPMGSESELVERLGRQGHKAWHVPDAIVEHLIQEYQMQKGWALSRAIRFGRGQLRLLRASEPEAIPSWLGVPPSIFPRMLKRGIRIVKSWLLRNEQKLFTAEWEFNNLLGHVLEGWRLHREHGNHD